MAFFIDHSTGDLRRHCARLSRLARTLAVVSLFAAPFVCAQASPTADHEIVGRASMGAKGISETTASIMKRDELERAKGPKPFRKMPEHDGPDRSNLPQDPAALSVSRAPSRDVRTTGPATAAPLAAQTLSTNFIGPTMAETNSFPPDTMGAVGPSQFFVFTNGRLRTYSKATGVADNALNADPDVFFNSVLTPGASSYTTDPRIRYDRLTKRWILAIIDVPNNGATANRVMFAVSGAASNGVITAGTVWTFYQFQQDQVSTAGDTGWFADYPTLGLDANALYIGCNMFGGSGNNTFEGTTGFVVQKASILNGGPIVVTAFRQLASGSGAGPYTPQGVDNMDSNQTASTPGYFIGMSNNTDGRLVARRVTNAGTASPTMSASMNITVLTTADPIAVPHSGNTRGANGNLDALDSRLFNACMRNGHIWTAHNILVDTSGVGSAAGTRDAVRWYDLNATSPTATPTPSQQGTIFDATASNPRFYWIPSIMVSGQGHTAIGYSTAGALFRADAAFSGRLAQDSASTTQAPVLYTTSSTAYNPSGDTGSASGRRWGDYSFTSLDPNDDMTMWTVQQYCNAANSYAVRIAKLLAPPPASPSSCNPSAATAGTANLNVVVTGTSVSGSGFYEPGVDFPNHIAATVSGTGVTVNSIAYTDPTHVTVNLTIAAGTAAGGRTLTVTNPDGQATTSAASIFTVTSGADVSVTQAGSPDPVAAGYKATYHLTVANQGPDAASGVVLTESLPAGSAFVSASPAPSGQSPSSLTFELGSLAKSAVLPVTVTVSLPSNATGTAAATANVAATESDPVPANNSATATLTVSADSDHDGMPDSWESMHGLNPNDANDAGADADGDGFTNRQEYLAGTDPASGTSRFSLNVVIAGADAQVNFNSLAGRTYLVEKSNDLSIGSWSVLASDVAGTGNTIVIPDPNAVSSGRRLYRVTVQP